MVLIHKSYNNNKNNNNNIKIMQNIILYCHIRNIVEDVKDLNHLVLIIVVCVSDVLLKWIITVRKYIYRNNIVYIY